MRFSQVRALNTALYYQHSRTITTKQIILDGYSERYLFKFVDDIGPRGSGQCAALARQTSGGLT
jgi:hypothetical protein